MKIIEQNRNEIILEKKHDSFFGAFAFFLVFGLLSFLLYFIETQSFNILARPLFLSYFFIILSIIILLFSGKKIITLSKMTNELVIENKRIIKKSKKKYLLNEIDCIIRKNKRQLRRVYGSNRLLKVAKYYLCLKDTTLIALFSYPLSSNYIFIGNRNIKEKEEVLKNLDILSEFLNINIKSQ